MKILEYQVIVAIPDEADDNDVHEQLRFLTAELSGDGSVDPARRSQAKAILQALTTTGSDTVGLSDWNQQACAALHKSDPLDLFADMRGRTERRQPR